MSISSGSAFTHARVPRLPKPGVRGKQSLDERHFRSWFTGLKHNIGVLGAAAGRP
jgi:hypothetical protein